MLELRHLLVYAGLQGLVHMQNIQIDIIKDVAVLLKANLIFKNINCPLKLELAPNLLLSVTSTV